jgi:hypothetical protein
MRVLLNALIRAESVTDTGCTTLRVHLIDDLADPLHFSRTILVCPALLVCGL